MHLPDLRTINYIGAKDWKFARFELNVIQAGEIGLKVNDPTALHFWIDGKEIPSAELLRLPLKTGKHKITVGVDFRSRPQQKLQIELIDLEGSDGQAQLLN